MTTDHRLWRREQIAGTPLTHNGIRLLPQSEAISIQWQSGSRFGPHAGLIWHRPTGLLVEQDGQTSHIPIVDVTRIAQLAFWTLAAIFALISWLYRRQ